MSRTPGALLLAAVLMLSGCSQWPWTPDETAPTVAPVSGFVTDLEAFEAFIAQRPTADQFRVRYPDVFLVMPGDITTRELRFNNSRYFATFDERGRITGGRFQ